MPAAIAIAPGSAKAARQPSRAASSAVVPDASAAPKLPHTPLRPSSRPSRASRALLTSMAEPTG